MVKKFVKIMWMCFYLLKQRAALVDKISLLYSSRTCRHFAFQKSRPWQLIWL